MPTGFADLDEKTSGLQPGDLVIIAGRPSMGKTALALNITEHVALNTKLPVAVFSMEMGASQLALRMIGSVGRLDQHKLRTGPARGGGLGEALGGARAPVRGADPHRRDAGVERDRGPLARAPAREDATASSGSSSSTTCS